ncbi:hypothetical protein [Nocardiopsis dassonvillei]|uniref:hypothetical protein n=1 Tax=Nocardiopsis dassonvillei TaxID=2014 RepID=UPI00364347C7
MSEPMESQRFRAPKKLWTDFGDAVARAEPEGDRSKTLRAFMRWFTGEPGARLPERPDPAEQ